MENNWQHYLKNSGPGWIQAAVTLGGGTLVSALYLGVIGGFRFLWLQPLAMICGVIMLSALSYINLSQDAPESRPFQLTKRYISPILAWSWLGASVLANVVFCAAQFALASDAIQGNLGITVSSPYFITIILCLAALIVIWMFSSEGKRAESIDKFIKSLVAIVIFAFMIVVVILSYNGAIPIKEFLTGWIPKPTMLFEPSSSYTELIQDTGSQASYWQDYISGQQRGIIIGAFGTAVGINMTFLLPYSQIKKNWNKSHRTFSIMDLIFGLMVPFIIASSCLIIATASQFHAQKDSIVSKQSYLEVLDKSLIHEHPNFKNLTIDRQEDLRESASPASKSLSTVLAKRSANDLAKALTPFLGKYSQLIFGIGILAMAFSTMLVHMMINGYAISEGFGKLGSRKYFMLGAMVPAISGLFSPIVWAGSVKAAVIVPASVIATTLLPIAYLIIILLMNNRKTLGGDFPKKRILVNTLMILSASIATFASVWGLMGYYNNPDTFQHGFGLLGIIGLIVLAIIGLASYFRKSQL